MSPGALAARFHRGAPLSRLASPQLWGDGFADDGWHEIKGVISWAQCCSDELYRKFPHLDLDLRAPLPHPMRASLARALETGSLGCAAETAGSGKTRVPPCRPEILELVGALTRGPVPANLPPFDDALASDFAFICGVHPAYIWPEALLAHDRFASIGWLGYTERHRCALMPLEVAQYIVETIVERAGRLRPVDDRLSVALDWLPSLGDLRRTAERRLRGGDVVFESRDRAGRGISRWLERL